MIFLAPWALAIGALSAAGVVLLHLVARQRPAAYLLPTTRFIPDQRTLVSRAAARPRDLVLLALRVLLLLAAGAAFSRPILAPTRGAMARVVLLDRSRAAASTNEALARVRTLVSGTVPTTIIAFDSIPTPIAVAALDSVSRASRADAEGSLSAAFAAARRAGVLLAEHADSVQLVVVSPMARSEIDSATQRIRDGWHGAVQIERVALRADSNTTWRLEHGLSSDDPLGPSVAVLRPVSGGRVTRLIRRAPLAMDSAFARDGGTVVWWDSTSAVRPVPEGLAVGEAVIVAVLGRRAIAPGRVRARWADGTPAAADSPVGAGCVRDVGIVVPPGGDLALHAPFQRIVRTLLMPCGVAQSESPADSAVIARLVGSARNAAPSAAMRSDKDRPSPLARWLLGLALLLAITEVLVRARRAPEVA